MSKSKHSEEQIIAALKQVDSGRAAEDIDPEYGVSKHTIYTWKANYGRRRGSGIGHQQAHAYVNDEVANVNNEIAVEMPFYGKRGNRTMKLSSFPSSHRTWKSPKSGDSHIPTATAATGYILTFLSGWFP